MDKAPDNNERFFDHRETFDEVIEPMMEKIRKVCEAFNIPHIMIFQTGSIEQGEDEIADVISGGLFAPQERTGALVRIGAHILGAEDNDSMKARVMKLAAFIAMKDMEGAMLEGRGEMIQELREMFAELGEEGDKVDKPLN